MEQIRRVEKEKPILEAIKYKTSKWKEIEETLQKGQVDKKKIDEFKKAFEKVIDNINISVRSLGCICEGLLFNVKFTNPLNRKETIKLPGILLATYQNDWVPLYRYGFMSAPRVGETLGYSVVRYSIMPRYFYSDDYSDSGIPYKKQLEVQYKAYEKNPDDLAFDEEYPDLKMKDLYFYLSLPLDLTLMVPIRDFKDFIDNYDNLDKFVPEYIKKKVDIDKLIELEDLIRDIEFPAYVECDEDEDCD